MADEEPPPDEFMRRRDERALTRRRLLVTAGAGVVAAACGGRVSTLPRLAPSPSVTATATAAPTASSAAAPAGVLPGEAPRQVIPSLVSPAMERENREHGEVWRLRAPARFGEVSAYCSETTYRPGDRLRLYASVRPGEGNLKIAVFRLGWYAGAGGRLMTTAAVPGPRQGHWTPRTGMVDVQRVVSQPKFGCVELQWEPAWELDIPTSWPTGVYLVRLTTTIGRQSYAPFVIDDGKPHALLMVLPWTTYVAYNPWGGKSLYEYNSSPARTVAGTPRAVRVSLDRPFEYDFGTGFLLRYEISTIRWLESQGFDVGYLTSCDLDAANDLHRRARALLFHGHDEYWSAGMRSAVEGARDGGTGLCFLSGNTMYWQIRCDESSQGRARRALVCYKDARIDPAARIAPPMTTVRWIDPPVSDPQSLVTGLTYGGSIQPPAQDWVIDDPGHWVFAGLGVRKGERVPGVVGYEFDTAAPASATPQGLQMVARSPVRGADGPVPYQATTVYRAASGAWVFNAGTIQWCWGLDNAYQRFADQRIQRATLNVLKRMTESR